MTEKIRDNNFLDLILWLIRLRKRVKVMGLSMYPLLKPDEEVLINEKAYLKSEPQIGDIIVMEHPYKSELQLIKRISKITSDQEYFVIGENRELSTDSRHFGVIKPMLIKGKVTCKFG